MIRHLQVGLIGAELGPLPNPNLETNSKEYVSAPKTITSIPTRFCHQTDKADY